MLYPDVPSIKTLHYDIHLGIPMYKALGSGKPYNPNAPLEPVYIVRSLLLSAIAVPFYYAAAIVSVSPITLIGLCVNSLMISLTCVVLFCFALEIYASKNIAFILSLIYGVCSFVWPYNTTFWSMPLQALCIVASAYFIYLSLHRHYSFICHYTRLDNDKNDRNKGIYFAGLGGLFLGSSVFALPNSIVLIPGFIIYSIFSMKRNRKSLTSFLITLAVVLSFMGLVNYVRFGSFTNFGYGYLESLAAHMYDWSGLVGLLVSPGAGLIFYFPIAILLPLAFKYMYTKNKGIFFLSVYLFIAAWLYIGTTGYQEPFGWSGQGWGPRYFISILPLITLVSGALLIRLKKLRFKNKFRFLLKVSIIILCVAGFYVNLVGKLVWYMYGYTYGWEREQLARFSEWPIIMTWNLHDSPIILHTKALISNFVSSIQPENYINSSWHWAGYGLAPCSYDDYFYCKFGIAPILFLSAAIVVLGIAIIKEITGTSWHLLSSFSSTSRTAKVKRKNTG
ncbi:MAG TPA: hypothetical protein VN922_12860 [Bacteroidia bacterium]|nr:hypothetical protein [Bacteroidia bacterium]